MRQMENREEKKELSIQNIQKKLAFFFPEEAYSFTVRQLQMAWPPENSW